MAALTNNSYRISFSGDYYGLGGNDVFQIERGFSLNGFSPMASGGQGDDRYEVVLNGSSISNEVVSIHENGYSTADSLSLDVDYFSQTDGLAMLAGSHLFIGQAIPVMRIVSGVFILDWQERGHEIETFTLAGQSYSHAEFTSKVLSWNKLRRVDADAKIDAARDQADQVDKTRFANLISNDYLDVNDAIFRFYNHQVGSHFYTSSSQERDFVLDNLNHFTFEGVAFGHAGELGDVDVFRFVNLSSGTHFYTSSVEERDYVVNNLPQFTLEGVAYRAYSQDGEGLSALHRFWNSNSSTHFYTASEAEKNWVESSLSHLQYEGIAYYVSDVS